MFRFVAKIPHRSGRIKLNYEQSPNNRDGMHVVF